jgi:hypothetical protein
MAEVGAHSNPEWVAVSRMRGEEEKMEKQIETLLSTLDDIVRAGGTWTEKRDKIMEMASENDKTNIMEFVTWFDDDLD